MGVYLNSRKSGSVFRRTAQSLYFVDKTAILDELIPTVEQKKTAEDGQEPGSGRDIRYICITRPRRFGKTVMASMIASYFGKGEPSREAFQGLEIGKSARFEEHLNRHNVIYISFNEVPDECRTYEQYISRIKKRLLGDLRTAYPDAGFTKDDAVWDALYETYMAQDIHPRNVTREGLRYWYDGYHTKAGERVYNPRSVVLALNNNNLGNYWTSSGPYDELFYYIGANVDAVKDDVGLMIADIPVPAKVREYAATSMELKTRDEKISGKPEYTGRILAVGIAYDKNDPQKRHECKVEVLREKL